MAASAAAIVAAGRVTDQTEGSKESPPRVCGAKSGRGAGLLQRLGLEVGAQAVDHVLQIAVHQPWEVVLGHPDAVICQAVLRKL